MGHGHSKRLGSDENGDRLYCRMDGSMTTSVVVPEDIAEKYSLQFEKWVGLTDAKEGVYCCHVEQIGGRIHLTKGWRGFLTAIGATIGDSMMFDIRGADETVVWVYQDQTRNAPSEGAGSSMNMSQSFMVPNQSITEEDHVGYRGMTAEDVVHADRCELGVTNRIGDVNLASDNVHMANVLDTWRAKFVVGRNVVLEDWMIEFVAAGLEWKLPVYAIYVGRVEGSSILSNRMRLPRTYTAEHIIPLLELKPKSYFMETGRPGGKRLKFLVGKDGRANLSQGWTAFARDNGIREGSILAFRFDDKTTELDIAIDLLQQ